MAGKDVDSGLLLILAQLKNQDEDAHTRPLASHTLSKKQIKYWRKRLKKRRDEALFQTDIYYIRTKKNGKKYLVRSRRIHSDNLTNNIYTKKDKKGRRKLPYHVGRGAII
jgi:hypothetical protein